MKALSNLPPGVTDNMIPGDRPEDIAWEEFYEKWLPDVLAEAGLTVEEAKSKITLALIFPGQSGKYRITIEEIVEGEDE